MFTPAKKQLDYKVKTKLNGEFFYQTDSVNYQGIQLDKYLTQEHQINNVAIKLNKTNAILSRVRHYVNIKTFPIYHKKLIYHAIFESHLSYASSVRVQNSSFVKRLYILKKKSLRLMINFPNRNTHTGPLSKNLKMLKFRGKVANEYCILVIKSLRKSLPKIICEQFILFIL